MKRKINILLLMALLLQMTSCGSGDTQKLDNTEKETIVSVDTTETIETDPMDTLPAVDYDGYAFSILGRNSNFVYTYEVGTEELNGEVINDAAYNRNLAVESKLNITIEQVFSDDKAINEWVRNTVQAADASCDLVFNAAYQLPTLAPENLLYDMYNLPYVDFSKPWWSENAMDALSINHHSFFAVGDASISNIGIAMCIFYNVTLAEEYALDDIYSVVLDGKWTYDYLSTTIQDIVIDTNGDGVMDEKDTYGFGNNIGSTLQPFIFSLGGSLTTKDENDIPRWSMNNEGFVDIVNKVYALHLENEGTYAVTDFQVPRTMFANRQLVFNTGAVYHVATLYRDMEDIIGILPFPKADETMEGYHTCHDPSVSLIAIPNVILDMERTGIIVEALAIESYKTLTPAFYETALKVKYSISLDSVQVLDMIKDGVTYDIGILYGAVNGSAASKLSQCLQELFKKKSTDFASYYATNAPAAEVYLTEIVDAYLALD